MSTFCRRPTTCAAQVIPGSGTAITELMYLAHLPPTDDTPVQKAAAQSDVHALDSFFGTPGLMS